MGNSIDTKILSRSRPCNHRGCENSTSSLRRSYCCLSHELLDFINRDLLYEGVRKE